MIHNHAICFMNPNLELYPFLAGSPEEKVLALKNLCTTVELRDQRKIYTCSMSSDFTFAVGQKTRNCT